MMKKLLLSLALMLAVCSLGAQQRWIDLSQRTAVGCPTQTAHKTTLPVKQITTRGNLLVAPRTAADKASSRAYTRADNTEGVLAYCSYSEEYVQNMGLGDNVETRAGAIFSKAQMSTLKGNKITKLRVRLGNNLSATSVWITKTLNATDQANETFTPVLGWNEITLKTPCVIDGSELFIGVTTTQKICKEPYPLYTSSDSYDENSFILYYSDENNEPGWYSFSSEEGALQIQALVEGDIPKNNASLEQVSYNKGVVNQEFTASAVVTNNTLLPFRTLEVTYQAEGGQPASTTVTFDKPIAPLMSEKFSFKGKTPSASGCYPMNVTISKVDGSANNATKNTLSTSLIAMEKSYPNQVVVEEATSINCPACSRGIAGLEMMTKKYPDFIGIAIHGNFSTIDSMTLKAYDPIIKKLRAYPMAWFNRAYVGDPYFGVEDQYLAAKARPCEASIDFTATYTDSTKQKVNVTSTVEFSYSLNKAIPYRLMYVLLENGVTGVSQRNYYSGLSYDSSDNWSEEMIRIINSPDPITNIEFNDVARGVYDDCWGIEGSLPGELVKDTKMTHNYTFSLPPKVQNKEKLSVVAILISEASGGDIVNAQKIKITPVPVSVQEVSANGFHAEVTLVGDALQISAAAPSVVEIYDASGVRVAQTTVQESGSIPVAGWKGIFVVRVSSGHDVVVRKISL